MQLNNGKINSFLKDFNCLNDLKIPSLFNENENCEGI